MRRSAARLHLGLLREGLRARARLHGAVLAAAALVVAAAVVGSVYAAAAQESVLRDVVSQADPGESGLHLLARSTPDVDTYPASDFARVLPAAPHDGRFAAFPRGIQVMTLPTSLRISKTVGDEPSRLVWREGFCAHVRVLAGRCPTRAGEGMVSRRTAVDVSDFEVGARFTADGAGTLTVVGIYRPISESDPYWFGVDYFDGGLRPVTGGDEALYADTVFVAEPEFVDRVQTGSQAAVDYAVDPDAVLIGNGSGLLDEVAAIRRAVADSPFDVQTALPTVLRAGLAQRSYVSQGAGLVSLQLVLLGVAVLFFIVLDLTEGRRREIALAKLRGQSGSAVARFALAEPLVVLIAALPVGVVLGWLAGVLLGAVVLRPGTPVLLPVAALGGALVALLGAVAAAVVATARVLTRPVLRQWSDAEPPAGRVVLVLQIAAAALAAIAATALLVAGTAGAPTAVLVPALLLVAAALVGVPLLVVLARRLAPRSRASERIAGFLVIRQLARSRAARRTTVLLVVTLGLAAFAVGGQSVLTGNRLDRARTELGATRVVAVAPDGGADPVAVVQRLDPDRRWAMAAATWLPDGGDSVGGTVLAVDPSRLAAVGLPVTGGLDDGSLARAIDAGGAPALEFTGSTLTATLTASGVRGDLPPQVLFALRTTAGRELRVVAGAIEDGRHDYRAAVPCARGCAFRAFVWQRQVLGNTAVAATVTVDGLAADGRALPARTTQASAWRAAVPVSDSADRVTHPSAGVTDAFRVEDGEAGLTYAATRLPVPVVVAPEGLVRDLPSDGLTVIDGNGAALAFRVAARTPILPVELNTGVLMDVRALDRELAGFAPTASWQVWLSPSAPADALSRLTRAGLITGTVASVSEREAELSREGPALAFSLLLALAIAAAVLAVLATAVSAGAAARGRSREAAAMRLIGVPAPVVVRAAVAEQVALLVVAAVLALPAGVLAVLLVIPLVRETATASPVPLHFLPAPLPLVLFVGAYAVVVVAVAALVARGVVSAADPRRLREVDG